MANSDLQYKRKCTLVVTEGEKGLDLSELRITFATQQQDVESPSNVLIRVHNLADDTEKRIRGEFSRVTLQAGYDAAFGVIFQGQIKQFGMGRVDAKNKYLDLLCADGDEAYNFAYVNKTLAAGSNARDEVNAAGAAMKPHGIDMGYIADATGGVLPRGKVLFGLARASMRRAARNMGTSWTINNGQVNVVPLDGYLPGEAVALNSQTGMIGVPQQTENGLIVTCLLNPKIVVGGLIQINERDINRVIGAPGNTANVAYNTYTGVQRLATTTFDGFYRVIVAEHRGDTRGQEWYTTMTCLAVNRDTLKIAPETT